MPKTMKIHETNGRSVTIGLPDIDLTFENNRRGLYHAGRVAGWKTWRGHRISNLIEMTDTYRTAMGDQKVNLAKSIERTMDELASDRQ